MKRRVPVMVIVAAASLGSAARVAKVDTSPARFEQTAVPSVSSKTPLTSPAAATVATPSSEVTEGGRLFVGYNCGDCHGAGGSGAMAPSLQDNRWRFGGSQSEVFRSIAEGRPAGMPAWGAIISGPEMIALVAYVRSLGEGKDLTTENFTGVTVERAGR